MRHSLPRLLLATLVLALIGLAAWELVQERGPAGAAGPVARPHAALAPATHPIDKNFYGSNGHRVRFTAPQNEFDPKRYVVEPPPRNPKLATGDDTMILEKAGLPTDGPGLLDFFRRRTLTNEERDRIGGLVRKLGDPSYPVRRKTSAELVEVGPRALPQLLAATRDPDPERRRRAEDCLREIGGKDHPPAVLAAAARLVGTRKPEGSAAVLAAYLPYVTSPAEAETVRNALVGVAVHDGKAEPVLVDALDSEDAGQRGAAAEVLCRAGARDELPKVRRLLQDSDRTVRLQVALALARARETDAVPVLIELLDQLPVAQAWYAEDTLCRLAEDDSPPSVPLGRTRESQERCREAWAAWWKDHAAAADLAKLADRGKPLGYTMLVLLNAGKVREVTTDGKVRWEVEGLQWPLDAQLLPGNRLLVAEGHGNRVTERDLKGEVLWERAVESPLVAQRLPNGNTFIANMAQMIEVDRAGTLVHSCALDHATLRKAVRLPNGDFACVTSEGKFVRFDATGKEVHSFPAVMHHYGGRLEVLPDGHVIVPQFHGNKVVEYDESGKVVWEATARRPIAAVRLPGGHTLVTFMDEPRAVELDRDGKEVWEYTTDTRVTRAWRR